VNESICAPHGGSGSNGGRGEFRPAAPPPSYSDGMSLKRVVWFLIILFALFFIMKSPGEAAHVVRSAWGTVGDWLGDLANSLRTFIARLV
jgi:hypothetical protein